ncbi:hypothetical protein [Bradyrhizobium sp. RT9a]|uniref:hypothetical protein n=1 Tax=Bradyrhizobium sp. RT9a TaxID=3156384 RepID=UPI0033929E4C
MTIERPIPPRAESVDSFSPPTTIPQRVTAKPLSDLARLRKEASTEIERLIAFLDSTEPDPDLEPSLGSLGEHHPDQTRWAAGDRRDLEQDPAESGIGDLDGLLEQAGSQDWQQGAIA